MAIVALIDYVPRLFQLFKYGNSAKTSYGRIPDFVIMPTVYGDISYLQNIDFLDKYSSKVIICTSRYESSKFYRQLKLICDEHGFRYFKSELPTSKGKPIKNAYTIYKGAVKDLKKLGVTPGTSLILIDADTYANRNINNMVRAFVKSNFDFASLRCEIASPTTIIEQLQEFEYKLAMDNRRMDPWLVSGAASIAKASVYQKVFKYHSNFFAGGDIEIGKLAQIMGFKPGHIDFTFYTAAPENIKAWYRQRLIWFAGGFRHHVANIGIYGWHHFFIFFYNTLVIYLLFPLRWIEFVNFPLTMVALILLTWVYTFLLTFKNGWKPIYLLLPAYAFIQSMIILPIAFIGYVKLAWAHQSLGILRYDRSLQNIRSRMLHNFLNTASAALVLLAAVDFTLIRITYWIAR